MNQVRLQRTYLAAQKDFGALWTREHPQQQNNITLSRQPAGSELALGAVRACLFCCKDRTGFVNGVCVWRQGEKNSVTQTARERERERERESKPGSGGAASAQNEAVDRRERLRRLALEIIDVAKDPYFMRNHLGSDECKLCLTLHNNGGNYLAHTQGKRHQTNLAKRAAWEANDAPAQPQPNKRKVNPRKTVKIGQPGYCVTKQYDQESRQWSLLFQIEYPEIEDGSKPCHQFMSSYEQRVQPWDKQYQYLLFAAEPYEIISFKVPSTEIDKVAASSLQIGIQTQKYSQ